MIILSSSELFIVPDKIEDAKTLQALSVLTFKETFGVQNNKENMKAYLEERLSLEQITFELEEPNSSFYFAIINKQCVGYLKLNFKNAQNEDVLNRQAFEIERIYILSLFQGKGLGSQLFQKAIDIGKAKKYNRLWLGVWEFNLNALAFYKRKGLNAFGKHTFLLGKDRQTDILMQLEF